MTHGGAGNGNSGDTHHLPGHGPVSFRLPHLGDLFSAVTVDPVTGDTLRLSERFSRAVQAIIRRWSFIGAVTLITLAWWTWPALFHDRDLAGWNRAASYLAILIESVVGIGVFGQTLRDAVVIRTILRMEREHGDLLRRLVDDMNKQKDNTPA